MKAYGHEATFHRYRIARREFASHGESEEEALANLKEALEIHFEAPRAARSPKVRTIEVEAA